MVYEEKKSAVLRGPKGYTCTLNSRQLLYWSSSQVNYLDASGGVGHDSDQSSYQQSDEEVSEDDSDDDVVEFTGEECRALTSNYTYMYM